MIYRKLITDYFQSKNCQILELKANRTLIIISEAGNQFILPLKRKYMAITLYFLFKFNPDFFHGPFNWKVEYHQMMVHIEINKQINHIKNK